jgi:hypothetical protein
MSASEKSIMNDALIECTKLSDTFLYRQNTGTAWQGSPVDTSPGEYIRVEPGMKILRQARPISFGLPGAGDIVGQRRGKPVQIEMKTLTGAQRKLQINFETQWVKRGGVYILARTADEAVEGLKKV